MPSKRPQLATGEIFHIVIRGVEGIKIFKDINDYYRGIFSLYEFNNLNLVTIQKRREARKSFKNKICRNRITTDFVDDRDQMVEVLVFCLMPNHLHLLIKQTKDNGISRFMGKLGVGYAGYFNTRYKHSGHVFQGRFKIVHIEKNEQLIAVFNYIHTNPLSLIEKGWKNGKIDNFRKADKFLENYKWSSYQDYIGKKNFPSVSKRDFLLEFLGTEEKCRESVKDWIRNKGKIKKFSPVALE